MIENRVRTNHESGEPVINGWLSTGSAFAAEVLAEQGFDSLTVDMQHGLSDIGDVTAVFQAIRASGVTPLTRVPWLEPGIIMKSLDMGALGIICPMINDREQAERLVSYMRYPPDGIRSSGPTRALISAGSDYSSEANSQVLCLAMVETLEGYQNIDEIVNTPGLDGIYIGPSDLTLGLTNGRLPHGTDREEEEIVTAIKHILEVTSDAGRLAALHCDSPEYAAKAIGWGFGMVTIVSDARLLATAAYERVSKTRALVSGGAADMPKASAGSY